MIKQFLRILKLQNCATRCESSLAGQQSLLLIDLILHLLSRAAVAHATHNGQGCLIVATPRNFAAEELVASGDSGTKKWRFNQIIVNLCQSAALRDLTRKCQKVRFKQQQHGI
jgi:hypothetical protein